MQSFNDKRRYGYWVYLYDNNLPIVMPSIYSRYTLCTGQSIERKVSHNREYNKTEVAFEEKDIGTESQYIRGNQLGLFLQWIDSHPDEAVSLSTHTSLPQEYINEYINQYLIEEMGKGEMMVNKAVYSLKGYYNWLHFFFDNGYKHIGVYPYHRELARENSTQPQIVKYLLAETRELLYSYCDSILEELILRNGGELGCRAGENQGFLLSDLRINGKKHKGLLSLFSDLRKHPHTDEFKYTLSSLYTKGKRSRVLDISNSHLTLMKQYYETERPITQEEHLFVSNSSNHTKGQCIHRKYASNTFKKVLRKVIVEMEDNPKAYTGYQRLEKSHVYHHLRHSFGTDIFYEECRRWGKEPESITTASPVYLETARRLGHTLCGKYANDTTKIYIHACGYREQLLKETVYGRR